MDKSYSALSMQSASRNGEEKRQQQLRRQTDKLTQFVVRMTRLLADIAPELSVDFANLQSQLSSGANFALVEPHLQRATTALKNYADTSKQERQLALKALKLQLTSLSQKTGIPDPLQQQIQQLQNGLDGFKQPLLHAQYQQSVNLYEQAFDNLAKQQRKVLPTPTATQATNNQKTGQDETQALHEQLCIELYTLLGQIGGIDGDNVQISELRERLLDGLSATELLESCLVVLQIMVAAVVSDRDKAERFVSSLHKTLHKTHQAVSQSIEQTQLRQQEREEIHAQMRVQLANMEQDVHSAMDLAWLKQQASNYLAKIARSLDDKQTSERGEQEDLIALLTQMQRQLGELEQEAQSYRQRLLKQQQTNLQDPLTQVPNRSAYDQRIQIEYRRFKRHGTSLSLALVDVDFFKKINDSYGHAAGDKTLQVIAQQLQKCLRATDFLARWGGEEFVLILAHTDAEQLRAPLEQMRKRIARIPFRFKQESVTITVSIGAYTLQPDDSIEEAFDNADKALYAAKQDGRNCCIIR